MAKIAFGKLGLVKNTSTKILEWNGQNIEVKQYLPMEDKLNMMANIINMSVDDNDFYNPCRIHIFTCLNIIENYAEISMTDKQKENLLKLYDLFIGSGLKDKIFELIPKSEIEYIENSIMEIIKSIYSYQNSAMGVVRNVTAEYNKLDVDAGAIAEKIQNPENLKFLRDVLDKLG